MQKAQAWCQKNKASIGLNEHPALMTDICSDAVAAVLVPSDKERQLIGLYANQEAMDLIADANHAATCMTAATKPIGLGWKVLVGTGAIATVALALKESKVLAGATGALTIAGGAYLGWSTYKSSIRRGWTAAWSIGA